MSISYAGGSEPPAPGTIALADSEVADEFFAFILGLLANDVEATYPLSSLLDAFPEYRDSPPETPIAQLDRVARVRTARPRPAPFRADAGAGGAPRAPAPRTAEIRVSFEGDLAYPIPVDFLGYHPGTVEVSGTVQVREHAFASKRVSARDGGQPVLSPLYVLEILDGWLFVDFDALVDILSGRAFDDLDAKAVLIFRHESIWYAMLAGEGHRDRVHEWTFNLKTTEFMRRPPRSLRGVSAEFLTAAGEP